MIKNIVFDFGQVLINFQPEAFLNEMFPKHSQIDLLQKSVFGSAEWLMLDRGVIDQQEAVLRLTNQYPYLKDEIETTFANWFSLLTPIEDSIALLPLIKEKGYRLYAISNFHAEAYEYVSARYDWLNLFDGKILSYQHQLLKPEPQIYRELLERYQLAGEECLFIDDAPANVEGARRMGIKAILYRTSDQLQSDLKKMLIF